LFSAPEDTEIEVVVNKKKSKHIRGAINRTTCFIGYSRFSTLDKRLYPSFN
jgi:hypothetical protein